MTNSNGASNTPDDIREVSIFLCYRRRDGTWFAEWLYKRLHSFEYRDADGNRCRLRVYYDETAPGVADWKSLHFPSLQTARALLVISTPGLAKDFSRRGAPDWCYEELRWWLRRRKSAPLVVETTGEGTRWLPDVLTRKWPDINRISLTRSDAESAVHAGDDEYEDRVRQRIIGAVRELEHQTIFEDLERSRRQELRLKAALSAAVLLLVLSTTLALYANARRIDAMKQTSVAEERQAVATEMLMRVVDQGDGATALSELLELMAEVTERKNEIQFVVVALDVLGRWAYRLSEPSEMLEESFAEMHSGLDSVKDEEVRSRLESLRAKLERAQAEAGKMPP